MTFKVIDFRDTKEIYSFVYKRKSVHTIVADKWHSDIRGNELPNAYTLGRERWQEVYV